VLKVGYKEFLMLKIEFFLRGFSSPYHSVLRKFRECVPVKPASLNLTFRRLFYVFHLMTCDSFYDSHPPYDGPGDRCSRDEIAAGTATQYSILGMSTTFCGLKIAVSPRGKTLMMSRYLEFICDGLDIEKVWTTCRSFGPNLHPCNSSRHTNNRCCGR
jgi:hypothetical protein